jgi:hypothetical protein
LTLSYQPLVAFGKNVVIMNAGTFILKSHCVMVETRILLSVSRRIIAQLIKVFALTVLLFGHAYKGSSPFGPGNSESSTLLEYL